MRDNLYATLEWLLAEARWWAENWKADSVRERWYLSEPSPFPWETPDGDPTS